MTSQDGKSNNRTAPNDPFKRAVTTTVRAIAQGRDLSVTFGGDRPGQSGNTVRLPEPSRAMTKHDAAVTRGYADALALRIACHDPAVHRKNQPVGRNARAIYEQVEQARIEAIGMRRFSGMGENLDAMLEDRCAKLRLDQAS